MRSQNRNRQICFICNVIEKEVDDYGNPKYGLPFPFYENIANVDGNSEIAEFGDRVNRMYKSIVDRATWDGKIHEKDKAYLEGITPTDEGINGFNANYNVESVRFPSLNTMVVYFEKR